MSQHIELTGEFQDHQFGQRLDQALAELFPDYSRTRIKEWILQDRVTLDGQVANTPREKVVAGQQVHVNVELADDTRWDAQNI
ncbi:MAG: 23S rRNA pseudouridine(1911/1915/1917) synthase RluD, partial [Aeromonas sp.]|nr:23S rRNA pseudouridine(1911/1915/1917) synthase RluD [Aeromonas sp.]